MTTIQLRRYEIDRDLFEPFVTWWQQTMWPTRTAFGYQVILAAADRERSEFTWAVSVEGGVEAFEDLEARYRVSGERSAALSTMPKAILSSHVSICESALPTR